MLEIPSGSIYKTRCGSYALITGTSEGRGVCYGVILTKSGGDGRVIIGCQWDRDGNLSEPRYGDSGAMSLGDLMAVIRIQRERTTVREDVEYCLKRNRFALMSELEKER